MTLELVSFPLCPFVQRAVIALREKGVPFTVSYIDLDAPPEWFLEMSPLGKVPLLQVDGTVLFESAVINEFLDETHPPRMLPEAALQRARARAWIEFASGQIGRQYMMLTVATEAAFDEQRRASRRELVHLEAALGAGPLYAGEHFSLVDAAIAPWFMRLRLMEDAHALGMLDGMPKLAAWGQALCARESVRQSVPEHFDAQFRARFRRHEGWFGQFL